MVENPNDDMIWLNQGADFPFSGFLHEEGTVVGFSAFEEDDALFIQGISEAALSDTQQSLSLCALLSGWADRIAHMDKKGRQKLNRQSLNELSALILRFKIFCKDPYKADGPIVSDLFWTHPPPHSPYSLQQLIEDNGKLVGWSLALVV